MNVGKRLKLCRKGNTKKDMSIKNNERKEGTVEKWLLVQIKEQFQI